LPRHALFRPPGTESIGTVAVLAAQQQNGIMKNMIRDQTRAIAIQVPSTLSSGCFHQTISAGG